METRNQKIDGGAPFDWGRASLDYAKYRDIYPDEFYRKITDRGLCIHGQCILDIGTGTGVLPRNLYPYGGHWIGADVQPRQIEQAKLLSKGKNIEYIVSSAEAIDFPKDSFDVITACQCFWYFDHEKAMPIYQNILKPNGSLLILYMAWLPFEDCIANASEKLVLKYNPNWSGAGERMHPISIPPIYKDEFTVCYHEEFKLNVHFTRETWNGRMKACRGIGASLNVAQIKAWEEEHLALLASIADDEFDVLHYAAIAELKKK